LGPEFVFTVPSCQCGTVRVSILYQYIQYMYIPDHIISILSVLYSVAILIKFSLGASSAGETPASAACPMVAHGVPVIEAMPPNHEETCQGEPSRAA
jgi:hypothetical protein